MAFLHAAALEILKAAGAEVESGTQRVRVDRGLVLGAVAKAPSSFTRHARNPAHNVEIGGDSIVFVQVASPPNVSDCDGGRRVGNYKDFANLLRLAQASISSTWWAAIRWSRSTCRRRPGTWTASRGSKVQCPSSTPIFQSLTRATGQHRWPFFLTRVTTWVTTARRKCYRGLMAIRLNRPAIVPAGRGP